MSKAPAGFDKCFAEQRIDILSDRHERLAQALPGGFDAIRVAGPRPRRQRSNGRICGPDGAAEMLGIRPIG